MRRKFIVGIITLTVMVLALPFSVLGEETGASEIKTLYVGSTAIVENGFQTSNKVEGATYSNGVLYLSGADIETAYSYTIESSNGQTQKTAGIYSDGPLSIVLDGDNSITAQASYSLFSTDDLKLGGSGNLKTENSGDAICAKSASIEGSGSISLVSTSTGVTAKAGDILVKDCSLSISTSSTAWSVGIQTVAGKCILESCEVIITEPTSGYTYGFYISGGEANFSNSKVTVTSHSDAIYCRDKSCVISSGSVMAASQIRAQGQGKVIISGGEVSVGTGGINGIRGIDLLGGVVKSEGRLVSDSQIRIDGAEIVLPDGVSNVDMEASVCVLNTVGELNYRFYCEKDSYLDASKRVVFVNADKSDAEKLSFFTGASGKKTYVKGCLAFMKGGKLNADGALEKEKLYSPEREGFIFNGWRDEDGEIVTDPIAGSVYEARWSYKLSFNGNGANDGSMSDQIVAENDESTTISNNGFTKTGYHFSGWNTSADGAGTSYSANAVASTVPGGTTLYAQWEANAYIISFSGGDDATGATASVNATYDKPATLTANGFSKTGYKFEGWDTDSSADEVVYSDATQVENLTETNDATVMLYAVWGSKPALEPNLDAQKVTYNGSIQKFSLPDGFEVSYERDGKKVEPKNVGAYDVVIHADETAEYAEYNATVYDGLVIEKAALTITPSDMSAYVGDAAPSLDQNAYKVEGLCGEDRLAKAPVLSFESTPDMTKPGSIKIVATGAEASDNYKISYVAGTLTVSNRPVTPPSSDKIEVEHNQDGSTTTTVTKPDGSQTITHETATGTVSVVKKDKDGNITSTEVTVSKKDADNGKVDLPVDAVDPAADADRAPEIEIKVPSSVTSEKPVQVTVPVAKDKDGEIDYGVVAVEVSKDGKETVLPKTAIDKDGNAVFATDGNVTIKVVDNAKGMPDVKDSDWFAGDVVDFATARGIVNGVALPDGSRVFDGYGKTTRGMFVAMLHNLELNPEAAGEDSLADVPENAFYADAAAWALEEGVLSGVDMPDGTREFQGEAAVTREQVAVFLVRYAEHLGMDVSKRAEIDFPDASEVSGFARDAMGWAVAEGLFKGNDATGELNPTDGAARAEVAAVLMRFINLMYA